MIRTAEVVAQKEQLAQKNKDITDSIRYAKTDTICHSSAKNTF